MPVDFIFNLYFIFLPYLLGSTLFSIAWIYYKEETLRIYFKRLISWVILIEITLLILVNFIFFILIYIFHINYFDNGNIYQGGVYLVPVIMLIIRPIFLYNLINKQVKYAKLFILSIIMTVGGILGFFSMVGVSDISRSWNKWGY